MSEENRNDATDPRSVDQQQACSSLEFSGTTCEQSECPKPRGRSMAGNRGRIQGKRDGTPHRGVHPSAERKSSAMSAATQDVQSPVMPDAALIGSSAWLGRIVCGDRTEILRSLPPESVDFTVTSPPYNCGKDYGATSDSVPWEIYWQQTREWLAEVLRVTKPGGRIAVNLPWWMGKKPRRDVPYEFQTAARGLGWLMLDKIIWVKGDENNIHLIFK